MIKKVSNLEEMAVFGEYLASKLIGGEVIELVGDIGSGKTTLTKSIVKGLGSDDEVQSPTFTLSRQYSCRDNIVVAHYDFYRLSDAGIMRYELSEATNQENYVTIIEWGEIVKDVLPEDRLTIKISSPSENERDLEVLSSGPKSDRLKASL